MVILTEGGGRVVHFKRFVILCYLKSVGFDEAGTVRAEPGHHGYTV